MTDRPLISVVSPVYGAEQIVAELVRQVVEALRPVGSFELVLVDDRSRDAGWLRIIDECKRHPEVRGVRLSRNSGQHAAIAAGLREACGEFVVVMDCDLQDDPAHIPRLIEAAREGHDIVLTEHPERRHAWLRNIAARLYLKTVALLTSDDSEVVGRGSYSLLTRKVVDAYNEIGDVHAHYLVNINYLGYERTYVEVPHSERFEGRSSYSLGRLVRHAIDGVVSNSVRLLNAVVIAGFVLFVLSLLGVGALVISYFVRGALAGYTSLMVVFLLMTGMVLLSVGVVGIYVGRIFEQGRGRPRFVVDQRVGFPEAPTSD